MIEFKLPSLGADMDEGTLLTWHVKPGDTVKRGQVVAVVDTSKAAVDVENWQDGVVAGLLVEPGQKVPVGTVLATLLAPGEVATAAGAPQLQVQEAEKAVLSARHPVSPSARRRAQELGLAPDSLRGTGPQGSVTLADIEAAAAAQRTPAPAAPERQKEMRKAIAAAMSRSKREIPHYYLSETVPMAAALAWLQERNQGLAITERLLPAVLLLKAVALALQRVPQLNGFYRDGGLQPSTAVHAGVAISLRGGGLVAPAIHDVQSTAPEQLMRALADLVRRARAGSLRSSEMTDPTITVTNLGDQGVETVFGVIYPPQVAIVGFGSMGLRPWVQDGKVCALALLTATLAADHRASDGHQGALFLAELRELMQQPEVLAQNTVASPGQEGRQA
jgi:pyruvate dehydrogenase E2 component (dihydrolipoamide acetyltransferase)